MTDVPVPPLDLLMHKAIAASQAVFLAAEQGPAEDISRILKDLVRALRDARQRGDIYAEFSAEAILELQKAEAALAAAQQEASRHEHPTPPEAPWMLNYEDDYVPMAATAEWIVWKHQLCMEDGTTCAENAGEPCLNPMPCWRHPVESLRALLALSGCTRVPTPPEAPRE